MFSLSVSPLYLLSSLTQGSPCLLTSCLGLSTPNNLGIRWMWGSLTPALSCQSLPHPLPVCMLLLSSSSLSFWQAESLNDIFCWLDAVRLELWVKNVREKPINLLSLLRIIPIQNNRNTSTLLAPFHSKQNTEKQMKLLFTNKCSTVALPGSSGDP